MSKFKIGDKIEIIADFACKGSIGFIQRVNSPRTYTVRILWKSAVYIFSVKESDIDYITSESKLKKLERLDTFDLSEALVDAGKRIRELEMFNSEILKELEYYCNNCKQLDKALSETDTYKLRCELAGADETIFALRKKVAELEQQIKEANNGVHN